MRSNIISTIAALALGSILFSIFQGVAKAGLPEWDHTAKTAFFGMVFVDTSTEGDIFGAREDEAARIKLIEDYIIEQFQKRGAEFVDTAPVKAKLDETSNIANCFGCELRYAAELEVDYVLVGVVQKVSNLILSMNLVMREVKTGKVIRALSVDFRSNTDASWLRAIRYILRYHYYRDQKQK